MLKPMLACQTPDDTVLSALLAKYRYYVSPKLDGIRCIKHQGLAMSRTMKPIPNRFVQEIARSWPEGLDGELIVGPTTAPDCYRMTNSGVMAQSGEPDFQYHTFDSIGPEPWEQRFGDILTMISNPGTLRVQRLDHIRVSNLEELQAYESAAVAYGHEGVMLRRACGPYKHGRSTEREGSLVKIKRFTDSEATVLFVGELLHNDNEATVDELGHTKRSSHAANKRASGTMGYLTVQDCVTGVTFDVGTGFDAKMREEMWIDQPIGRMIKYKSFHVGVKDKPRHPVFLGFRDSEDFDQTLGDET